MNNISLVILGVSIIFLATTLGSAVVFLFKKDVNKKLNCVILGFASGVMVAASVWSLIIPSVERLNSMGKLSVFPISISLILGGVFIIVLDKFIPQIQNKSLIGEDKKKLCKLFFAVTVHNIPEGLAVGLAFGAALSTGVINEFYAALALAIGIAIQNIPEGTAISLPMREALNSKGKAFSIGVASGAVEPVAAIIGIVLATQITGIMPWLLSFAAGAMLFVVAEDLLPDAKFCLKSHIGTCGFMLGFIIMMALDIALS